MQQQTDVQSPPPGPPHFEPRVPFRWRWVLIIALAAIITFAAFLVPIPIFYAYLPGPVRDVERLVEVGEARTYSSEGSLYLTTVSVDINVTFAEWVQALLDDTRQIVSRESVTGGRSFDDLEEQQLLEMKQSKQQAREVALTTLGYEPPTGEGARVLQTFEGSPAAANLERDDVIVAVDGEAVETTCDASELIGGHEPGDDVTLEVRRNGTERTVRLTTAQNPQEPAEAFVGVFMETVGYRFDPGVEVKFKTGNIAGPSAGLMFTLALYDQLTPDDLTHGQRIAGTGTIGCGGEIGPIGGIQQKVAAAQNEGASVFLAPEGNYEEARQVADDIRVVKVATFDDARTFLEGLQ